MDRPAPARPEQDEKSQRPDQHITKVTPLQPLILLDCIDQVRANAPGKRIYISQVRSCPDYGATGCIGYHFDAAQIDTRRNAIHEAKRLPPCARLGNRTS